MVVNVGANSGSSVSEQHIIDSVEFVNQIRPGQIQNYVWDTATSSWIPEQAYSGDIVVVYLSGATITASVSGQVVWGAPVSGYATSGQLPVLTISGSAVMNAPNVMNFGYTALRSPPLAGYFLAGRYWCHRHSRRQPRQNCNRLRYFSTPGLRWQPNRVCKEASYA